MRNLRTAHTHTLPVECGGGHAPPPPPTPTHPPTTPRQANPHTPRNHTHTHTRTCAYARCTASDGCPFCVFHVRLLADAPCLLPHRWPRSCGRSCTMRSWPATCRPSPGKPLYGRWRTAVSHCTGVAVPAPGMAVHWRCTCVHDAGWWGVRKGCANHRYYPSMQYTHTRTHMPRPPPLRPLPERTFARFAPATLQAAAAGVCR